MNSLKKNRAASFAAVTLVYISAAVLGILLYQKLPFAWWANLLLADVAATVLTFVFSVIFGNASVYDPYWSVQPIVIGVAFSIVYGLNLSSAILLTIVCLWGLRLTANWAYTFKNLYHQDWRYTMLCEKTGKLYPVINFLGIHLVPTLVVYACTLPMVAVILYQPAFNSWMLFGAVLSVFAFTMQGIADIEMHRFRKRKTGGFIRDGLWKYSRHPNYLGEMCMWWGVAFCSFALMPTRWYFLFGALFNTALFLFVSIPMAERRQSKKDGYAEYKKQTRVLLPIKK
jgi:steroid 5-alpha reductase family enzyme